VKTRVKDGDYVYSDAVQGVFWKGGIIADMMEDEETDPYDQWKNKLLRDSFAKS